MLNSLRTRLTLIFIGLAVGPLILVSAIIAYRSSAALEEQSLENQRKVAAAVISELHAFITLHQHELALLNSVMDLGALDIEEQRQRLSTLLHSERSYQEISLIDASGEELIQISRFGVAIENEPVVWTERDDFAIPRDHGEPYCGAVEFNPKIREPVITVSAPMLDLRTEEVRSVVVATLKFQVIWDYLTRVQVPAAGEVYVLDQSGLIIAHRNPTIVLRGTTIDPPSGDGRFKPETGPEVIVVSDSLVLGDKIFTVVAEQPTSEALRLAINNTWSALMTTSGALITAVALVILTMRRTIRPIEELAISADAISHGDFSHQVEVSGHDEVFRLADSFDRMRRRLSQSLTAVELEVTIRRETEEMLRQAVKELTRSNAELQQFAYVASHDLQEPLRKIQAFGSRLWSQQADRFDEQGRDYLQRMQSAAGRMQTMIEDLLALSQAASDAQDFAPVDLGQVARDALSDLEARLEQTAGRVDIDDLPTIDADPAQMQQLFLNLIGNGLKFHRPGVPPTVKVTAMTVQGNNRLLCQIAVEDNGIGFDIKYLDRIFQPFQRLHGRGKYEGTGIGLAVCRKVAEHHGGGISANSTPGQGATFVVTLPFTQTGGNSEWQT